MLVSIAIDPSCFGPMGVTENASRHAAERLLEACAENAVLLAGEGHDLVAEIISCVSALSTRLGQQLQIRAAELAKIKHRAIVVSKNPVADYQKDITQVCRIAQELRADIVVCHNNEHTEKARAILPTEIEVCILEDFPNSKTQDLRREMLQTQRLDFRNGNLSAEEIVGRIVRYGTLVVFADNYIGAATKESPHGRRLRTFVLGIIWVARQWKTWSPFADRLKLNVKVITAAGMTGARAGYIEPRNTEANILSMLNREDSQRILGQIVVALKQDGNPKLFRDRFMEVQGRCWGIRHSLEDIGQLAGPLKRRTPTLIDPHSEANRMLMAEIQKLPDL